ncbi:hypothetical protein QWT69_08235 [Sporosarcina oncorhynchi]|uniref:Uncharacterized protein n=1 Tax=Sporosarcina oncorhynchi TaxID=3056444 RepID=A0ABZ0L966_9BACL|nr:hypothetical protein [Sporosarcina sp. T2O-4]WOV89079.1 hypothetical protein QWT69_08235 [Sporosarcina sp. T2O-4]
MGSFFAVFCLLKTEQYTRNPANLMPKYANTTVNMIQSAVVFNSLEQSSNYSSTVTDDHRLSGEDPKTIRLSDNQ